MSRLADIAYDDMSAEQKKVHDAIVAGPRGRFVGPYLAWIRNPKLVEAAAGYGAFCRYESSPSDRIREFVILLVARHFDADVEWWAHYPIAIKAGLDLSVAEAVKQRQLPEFQNTDEEAAYAVAMELIENRKVSDATYAKALSEFGEKTLVELVAIIGNYFAVALILNCFEIGTPDGSRPLSG